MTPAVAGAAVDAAAADTVEKIAAAVLYEGYVLWPYRRSAHKNRQRWTLGGVYPRAWSEAVGGDDSDPWRIQTECLLVAASPEGMAPPSVRIRIRFLQVVRRRVARVGPDGRREFVDALSIGGARYLDWEEATEREIVVGPLALTGPLPCHRAPIAIPAGSDEEPLQDESGRVAGALVREWETLAGEIETAAEPLGDGLFRLRVRIVNTLPWSEGNRESVLRHTLVSTHTVLTIEGGEFVSLMDPPEAFAAAARACRNIKTWPVLAGDDGSRQTVLSSPIILYDYPRVAPESSGDFFDGGEIDQLLMLNILTLTDEEKAEVRATDPRVREILERTEALTADDFMSLHGVIRDFRVLNHGDSDRAAGADPFANPFAALDTAAPESLLLDGIAVRPGSRVRLRPKRSGDIFDIALAGRIGVVESIEQDYEERVHLSVVAEDDPGRDMGAARILGHRFFFSPEEVEPLPDGEET